MTPAQRLLVAAYTAGWALLRAVPHDVALAGARGAGSVAARRGAGARLRGNLARATGLPPGPELDAVTRAGVQSYARYWVEAFRLPAMPTSLVVAGAEVQGEEHLDAAIARGRGVVLALPHAGNWDHAGAWLVATRTRFTTVAERLEPETLFRRFVRFREGLGMEVLPLTGGERPPLEVLADRLRDGGVLCLLADRDLTARGVDVTFLGAATRMPAGPAALALRTGAVLLPVTLAFCDGRRPWRGPGRGPRQRWDLRIHPPVPPSDVPAMTQALADVFGEAVRRRPADWHMLQRLWLDDLDPDDPRRARSVVPAPGAPR